MRVGAILLCRYNSTRLPGKILMPINDKPVISYLVERISQVLERQNVIIATSDQPSDNPIALFCDSHGLNCYRGSLDNVALRFLNAAKKYSLDYAARINGDNVFIDPPTLEEMIKLAESGKYDLITNVMERTFPAGMSIEIVKTSFYASMYQNFKSAEDFEHVTWYLNKNETGGKYYIHKNTIVPEAKNIHLALDTETDLNLIKAIMNEMNEDHTKYSLKDIFKIQKSLS